MTYGVCDTVTCIFGRQLDSGGGNVGFDGHSLQSVAMVAVNAAIETIDGKIAFAGNCSGFGQCVVRLNTNGSVDASFNASGAVTGRVQPKVAPRAIGSQHDGKLVVASRCIVENTVFICVERLNIDGMTDDAFSYVAPGVNAANVPRGVRVLPLPLTAEDIEVSAVAIRANRKFILSGTCTFGTKKSFCAVQLDASGAFDATFGTGGISTVAITAGDDMVKAAVPQPDGKLLLVGECPEAQNSVVCVARLNETGLPDLRFNRGNAAAPGTLLARPCQRVSVGNNGAILQNDGKLLVATQCRESSVSFSLSRFNADGSLDTEFGADNSPGVFKGEITRTPLGGEAQCGGAGVGVARNGTIYTGNAGASESGQYYFCASMLEGGSTAARNCSMDIDGDGRTLASIDALIQTRVALGFTGVEALQGITFPQAAQRTDWQSIRDYLAAQCGLQIP